MEGLADPGPCSGPRQSAVAVAQKTAGPSTRATTACEQRDTSCRDFQQGEVMPAVASDDGSVIWQWDSDQSDPDPKL
ncbi:hypothetical protein E7Z57_08215 [Ralstonia pseudosolanacearum]|uniref:Uncharacterized protein n=1 Tax=Ralstonia solanacearum TaxID=305 RepID=A0AA92ED65_RALSL|nr:hypothetical protein E7Z57_08215 [Ralstonia pseudosolanacearum]